SPSRRNSTARPSTGWRRSATNNTTRGVGDVADLTDWCGRESAWYALGGKSAPWQANPPSPSGDTPVESFCCWASDPHLRSVPGTFGQDIILHLYEVAHANNGFKE